MVFEQIYEMLPSSSYERRYYVRPGLGLSQTNIILSAIWNIFWLRPRAKLPSRHDLRSAVGVAECIFSGFRDVPLVTEIHRMHMPDTDLRITKSTCRTSRRRRVVHREVTRLRAQVETEHQYACR